MTSPVALENSEPYEVLRRRWLARYIRIQGIADAQLKKILTEGAKDAAQRVSALDSDSTFSAGVRSAQLRLVMNVVRDVHEDIFKKALPIIKNGQKDAAAESVNAFAATDRKYLRAALGSTSDVTGFVDGQRRQAEIQVAHAITRLTRSEIPLSTRVYRSRSLSNGLVQRIVTSALMRGDSAADIAKAVRSHIIPNTRGGTSYAALRLGRTEINNAFHATTIELTKDRPWVEQNRWHLSKRHTETINCRCEYYARVGIFDVDSTPAKPHPQCRCFVTPELIDYQTFVTRLDAGYYRQWATQQLAA